MKFLLESKEFYNRIKECILFSFKLLIEHYGDIFMEKNSENLINNYWKIV